MDRFPSVVAGVLLITGAVHASGVWAQEESGSQGFEVYQESFNAVLSDGDTEVRPKGPVWIQPEVVPEREACTSCHLGIQSDRFLFARLPYRRHSGHFLEDHPPERFGCTVCHGGAPGGLSFRDALHPRPRDPVRETSWSTYLNWQPVQGKEDGGVGSAEMIPLQWITGRCIACHSSAEGDVSFEPYTRSRDLVAEKRCTACHVFRDGPEKNVVRAVHLDGIGSKDDSGWLRRYLRAPAAFRPGTAMPAFAFGEEEVITLSAYLSSLTQADLAWNVAVGEGDAERIEHGRMLAQEHRCTTCHDVPGIEEQGFIQQHKLGPDLGRVGEKLNPAWIERWVPDPDSLRSGVGMPPFHLKSGELEDLSVFLSSLRGGEARAGDVPFRETSSEPDVEAVTPIIDRYGCAACHLIPGVSPVPPEKTDLSTIAAELFARLSQPGVDRQNLEGPDGVFHRSSNAPRLFEPGEGANGVLSFLAAQVSFKVPESFQRRERGAEPSFDPAQAAGGLVEKLRCLSCHAVGGRGGTIGPDLSFAGSKLQRGWLVTFLQEPVPIRPMNRARMPLLGLTEEQAVELADWMEADLHSTVADEEPAGLEDAFGFFGASAVQSPYGCVTCHRLADEGGMVGPDWTHVGSRLKPNWIYHWIEDPDRWIPGVRMPRFEMSDEDRLAITKFLSEQP